jgi:hypothetical protein
MHNPSTICFVLLVAFLATVLPFTCTGAQESTPVPQPEQFIGVWKLDLAKHPRSGIRSESLTIEKQQNNYKITYDWFGDKHDETHWSAITDMKGGVVKRVQPNGKPLADIRITRLNASSFLQQSDLLEERYQVAEDGQSMKMEMIYLRTGGNTAMPKIVLDYERAK